MRSDIPSDIWRYIAGLLPVAVLFTLASVNRTFYEVAIETRYRSINFVAAKKAKKLIKRVKDPKQVHSVRIQPWVVIPKEPKAYSWPSSAWKLLNGCVSPAYAFEEDGDAQMLRRLRTQTQRVADFVKGLPHLYKYHIDWDEGPAVRPESFTYLLDSVIPAIGYKLCALNLKVPLHHMQYLPGLATHLVNLQDLALTLHTAAHAPSDISQGLDGLVVFVNSSIIRNLRSLSINTTPTSTYLDLGPFFKNLGHGQRLTSFTLCIPFDGGHLVDRTSLRRFLIHHRLTLESVTLGTVRAAARPAPGTSEAKYWIRDTLKDHPPFPALSQLSLGLRPLRTDVGPLVRCLSKLRSQLRVLKLSERPLEYAELARVLDVLDTAPLLRVLSLRIRWLSPEIMDLLAANLPCLNSLDLHFTEVVHQDSANDVSSFVSEESSGLSREGELTLFCQTLQGKRYSEWKLTRLAIPESPRGRWLDAMERAFVACIPGLTSFGELV
ncbi:hypothetical protein B0H11DRAFT_1961405 [Mycena galericulata]|nr:hypothetical protein B0H11DRAFT_1961405 [Mycena galericulata]